VKNLPPSLNTVFGVTIEMTAGQLKKRLRPFLGRMASTRRFCSAPSREALRAKRSDVDILIVQETNKDFLDRFSDFFLALRFAEGVCGRLAYLFAGRIEAECRPAVYKEHSYGGGSVI